MSSLKKQAATGALWIGIERFGQQGIQFVVSIILARLLAPAEFGLIAMVAIFTSLATRLAFGGFSGALVQRSSVTDSDISTVLWYNISLGIIGFIILWLCAPYIADFYSEPRLTAITRWNSLVILFSSLEMTHGAMLLKEMQFRKRSVATILGVIISGGVSIIMAFKGFGVWALVAQGLVMHAVITAMYWLRASWRVRLVFDTTAFKEMFSFGHNLMLTVLVRTVFENIYAVIIGRLYTATDLGYFQRGKRFTLLFSQVPAMMLSQLSFPLLAKHQHNKREMLRIFSRLFRVGIVAIMPLLTGMAVAAPNMIVVLVGEKWLPSVPYLRILCVTGIFYTMFSLCSDVLRGCGEGRVFLKCEVTKHVLTMLSIIILFRMGIKLLLIGEAVATAIGFIIVSISAMRSLESSMVDMLKWLIKPGVAACVMGLVVGLLRPNDFTILGLGVKVMAGAGAYALVLIVLRDDVVRLIWNMSKRRVCGIRVGW
ncbi:MAG: lipopolysaccharide biosynthesis protein [Kiritimatiellales bacterium]